MTDHHIIVDKAPGYPWLHDEVAGSGGRTMGVYQHHPSGSDLNIEINQNNYTDDYLDIDLPRDVAIDMAQRILAHYWKVAANAG